MNSLAAEQKARKRGRPTGTGATNETSASATAVPNLSNAYNPTQPNSSLVPQESGTVASQASPTKSGTGKPPVIKALPTVRDHTTDQLTPEGDEYEPREFDAEGERKVAPTGHPQDGREYRMRTFYVPNRGTKLFMLATECARVLGYRDSYLLFNKNRSLFKIIATQPEKDELIAHDILPYSYRSRQIAIVTAKSMFRQFGARVITNGRRVRDDYWEGKAKKQGFTEDDMAGDKRPGTGKARDVPAADPVHPEVVGGMPTQDITYKDVPLPADLSGHLPLPNPHAPIPMIHADLREYGNIPRQRQDLGAIPYQDKIQSSPAADVMHQAGNAAELNKNITQQRNFRTKAFQDSWNKTIEPPPPTTQQKMDQSPTLNQSPHPRSTTSNNPLHRQPIMQHQGSPQITSPQRFQPHPNIQSSHNQAPARQTLPPSMRQDLHHPSRSSVYNPNHQQPNPSASAYGNFPQQGSQIWGQQPSHPSPQNPPHQSPVTNHHPSLSQHYSPSPQQQHMQHPSQSPHHQSPHQLPQLSHAAPQGNYYGAMAGMPPTGGLYGSMGQQRSMYHQQQGAMPGGSPTPQHPYMQQTTGAPQAGVQGYAPPPMGTSGQGWANYPASTGY